MTLYERTTSYNSAIPDIAVKRNLINTKTDRYQMYLTNQLITRKTLASDRFPKPVRELVRPLFSEPMIYDDLENLSVNDLFKNEFKNKISLDNDNRLPRILSDSHITNKNFTDYQAQIIKSLAAYYTPHSYVPDVLNLKKVYQWYHRLLTYSPIILFFKQKNRLFSNPSLHQINFPYLRLFEEIENLKSKHSDVSRSYHLTELSDIDILQLAIKSQLQFTQNDSYIHNFDPQEIDWASINKIPDKLCHSLYTNKEIDIINNDFSVYNDLPDNIFTTHSMKGLLNPTRIDKIPEIFPYDLVYNDYFILSIEPPILNTDHTALTNILNNFSDDFTCFSARLNLSNTEIKQFFQSKSKDTSRNNGTYEELLNAASNNPSHIEILTKRLAENGLTKVETGCHKNCIYLFQ